jgi:hypothetical protein
LRILAAARLRACRRRYLTSRQKKHIEGLQNPNAHHSLSQDVPAPAIKGEILNISAKKVENVAQVVWSIGGSFCSNWDRFLGFLQGFSGIYPTHKNLLDVMVLVVTVYTRDTVRKRNLSIADYRFMFFNYGQYNSVAALIYERGQEPFLYEIRVV